MKTGPRPGHAVRVPDKPPPDADPTRVTATALRRVARTPRYAAAVMAVGFALLGPLFVPHDPARIVGAPYTGDGGLLGTDHLGRDVGAQLLAGGRPLIVLPLTATLVACLLGTAIGAAAGLLGGRVDAVVGWATHLLLVVPAMLVLLVVLSAWGQSATGLTVAVVATGTPFVIRLARATTLRVAHSAYVEQAVGLGESTTSILVREILPNIAGPMLADAGTRLITAIELVAAAAFLGFGPDTANWASMIEENRDGMTLAPWSVAAPALALAVLAVSANLAMDRLTRGLLR